MKGSTSARRTPTSGISPMTGSVSPGPGPTVKVSLNWESPSTLRRIRSPTWNPLPSTRGARGAWGAGVPAARVCVCAHALVGPSVQLSNRSRRIAFICSFHRHALRQVTGAVHVAPPQDSDVVGQQLERDDRQDRRQQRWAGRNPQLVVGQVAQVTVPFARDRDDVASSRLHLLHVGEGLRVYLVLGREEDDRHVLVDQRDGPVLYLRRGIAFGVDVGVLLELAGALERYGEVHAPTEIERVVPVR